MHKSIHICEMSVYVCVCVEVEVELFSIFFLLYASVTSLFAWVSKMRWVRDASASLDFGTIGCTTFRRSQAKQSLAKTERLELSCLHYSNIYYFMLDIFFCSLGSFSSSIYFFIDMRKCYREFESGWISWVLEWILWIFQDNFSRAVLKYHS